MHISKTKNPVLRAVVVFAAATVLWFAVYTGVNAIFGSEYTRGTHVIRALVIFALAVPMLLGLRKIMEGKASLQGIGLQRVGAAWRPFLAGVGAWAIPAGAALAVALGSGWTDISLHVSAVDIGASILSLIVLVFIYEAFPEEIIFRGYILHNLSLALRLGTAVGVQALLFVAWGALNGGEVTADRAALFLVFGVVVGILRVVSGSVWTAIGYHVAFQVAAQLFGSVGNEQISFSSDAAGLVVFGLVPIACAVPVLRWFYKTKPDWRATGKAS